MYWWEMNTKEGCTNQTETSKWKPRGVETVRDRVNIMGLLRQKEDLEWGETGGGGHLNHIKKQGAVRN